MQKPVKFITAILLCALLFCGCGVSQPIDDETAMQCTISINCANAFAYGEELPEALLELLPADGVILEKTVVSVNDGDSVFDVLLQTAQKYGIHMEYVDTPVYNSAYIEGIGNLYEFDAGDHSGWMYSVNGEFPNYGCSSYLLNDGDAVQWVYTCNLGEDVGNVYGAQQ